MKKVFVIIAVLIVVALSAQSADVSVNGVQLTASGIQFASANQKPVQAVKAVNSGINSYTVQTLSNKGESVLVALTELNGMVVGLSVSYLPDSKNSSDRAILKLENDREVSVTLPKKSGEALKIAFKGPYKAETSGELKGKPYEFSNFSVNVPLN